MSEQLAESPVAGDAVDATADLPAVDAPVVEAPAPAAAFDFGAIANDPRFAEVVDTRAAELAESIVAQRFGPLEQMLRQALTDESGNVIDPAALDPWGDNFGGALDQRFQALEERFAGMINQVAEPLRAREQAEVFAEGESRLKDMVADDVARNGDFPRMVDPATGEVAQSSQAQEAIIPLARMLFPQIEQRFGRTPRAAEIAISHASQMVRGIVAEAAAHALHTEQNRLAALATANGEPSGNGVGGVRTLPDANSFSEVTRRHAPAIRAARS